MPKDNLRIATAGSFEDKNEAELWRQQVQDAFAGFHVIYDMLSCSVACHTGIGAVGLRISQVLKSEAEI